MTQPERHSTGILKRGYRAGRDEVDEIALHRQRHSLEALASPTVEDKAALSVIYSNLGQTERAHQILEQAQREYPENELLHACSAVLSIVENVIPSHRIVEKFFQVVPSKVQPAFNFEIMLPILGEEALLSCRVDRNFWANVNWGPFDAEFPIDKSCMVVEVVTDALVWEIQRRCRLGLLENEEAFLMARLSSSALESMLAAIESSSSSEIPSISQQGLEEFTHLALSGELRSSAPELVGGQPVAEAKQLRGRVYSFVKRARGGATQRGKF